MGQHSPFSWVSLRNYVNTLSRGTIVCLIKISAPSTRSMDTTNSLKLESMSALSGRMNTLLDSFFRGLVEKAYTAGIVTGQEDGKFHETDMVTREQYITMLYRTLEFVELELGTSVLEQAQDEIPFEDSGTISPWAEEAVRTLHALGVTHGENGNVFSPRDAVSFEQMLVLSYRCLTLFRT